MALKSMTGHGRGEASVRGLRVQVEIGSVNRKQLDVHINLPKSLSALDPRVTEAVQAFVKRGNVTGTIDVSFSEAARQEGVCVDYALAASYLREIKRVAAKLKLKDDLSARSLLNLPEVVRYEHREENAEQVWPVVRKALNQALAQLARMRKAEGAALVRDLKARLSGLRDVRLAQIRKHAPDVVAKYRAALKERLRKAGFTVEAADPQVLKELALFADRSDISEEITRLDSHLGQALTLLNSDEPVGRSLDFLAQEMHREINTIGSKASDAKIAGHGVQFKAELERIREQVQNVE